MTNFKRGDLIKVVAASPAAAARRAAAGRARAVAGRAAAAAAAHVAADQYWCAYRDKSIGLVVKADADHIWIRWFGSRSDQNMHKYYNKTKYFEVLSRG